MMSTRRKDSLKDYTNQELINYINNNDINDLTMMSGITSEILRRMNDISPLLPIEGESNE